MKPKTFSRRKFLQAAGALGVGASARALLPEEAASAPLRSPAADYGREQRVPVLCQMCYQFCPAVACVKDGKIIRL